MSPRVPTTLPSAIATVSLAAAAAVLTPGSLPAQERILGARSIGAGIAIEGVSFGGRGLLQPGFAGGDATRVTAVQQVTMPVSIAIPLAGAWRMDVTALYASGSVRYTDGSNREQRATLAGMSDVRLRASGPVIREGVVITVGANLPTGRTSLDPLQFATLRILSSPALGIGSTSVGSGPSGTVGLVLARPAGVWSIAAGASYEYRGEYQPVAAIAAGAPSADFQPGGVARTSLAADRPVGAHRLSIALAVDVFSTDRLRTAVTTPSRDSTGSAAGSDAASVRLGPVLSADAQMQVAARGVRDLLLYTSYRYRSPFSRDGARVASSQGSYLESGARAARALRRGADVVLSLDARWQSGLGIDQGLPTNGVKSAGATLGAQVRRGLLSIQPYGRVQAGRLRPTGTIGDVGAQGFGGAAAGLVVVRRF